MLLGGGTEEDKEVAEEEDLKGDMEGMSIAAQPGGRELKSEDSEPTEDEGTTKVVESGAFTISSTINRSATSRIFHLIRLSVSPLVLSREGVLLQAESIQFISR